MEEAGRWGWKEEKKKGETGRVNKGRERRILAEEVARCALCTHVGE